MNECEEIEAPKVLDNLLKLSCKVLEPCSKFYSMWLLKSLTFPSSLMSLCLVKFLYLYTIRVRNISQDISVGGRKKKTQKS